MNLTRSTFLVAGLALLAGACGDDVTVTETPTPTTVALIRSVEVAPATATVNTGASITFTAAINADPGLTPTVAWTASAGTITAAGAFTAPSTANPGIAVCATATAGTQSVRGCATVVVAAPAPVIPATVSIQSITATGNLNTTVNPANVAGGIDVRLNLAPGNQVIQRVVLLVGNVRVDSQVFTAAQAAEMRALAEQQTIPNVVFSVNTACYQGNTACPSTAGVTDGTPRFMNGQRAVSAQIFTSAAGTVTAGANAQTNLTFNNVDGFHLASVTFPSAGALDANGFRWFGNGSFVLNLRPVMYSGATVGSIITTLANTGSCTSGVPAAGVTQAMSATSAANPVDTISFGAYSYNAGAASCSGSTPQAISIAATDANGNSLTLVANGIINSAGFGSAFGATPNALVRWDNVAPGAPAAIAAGLAVNGRTGNWINDAVSFNTINSGTAPNGAIAAAVTDNAGGIGLPATAADTYYGRAAASTTVATVAAGAIITDATSLAASATNATYCVALYARDRLGNQSANPANCAAGNTNGITVGVDRAAPTITFAGGPAANARLAAATIGTNWSFTVNDTGTVGNSGMNATAPALGQITQRNATATTALNVDGTAATTAGTLANTGWTLGLPTVTTASAAIAQPAYFTVQAQSQDAAGNRSAIVTRTIVVDNVASTGTFSAGATIASLPIATSATLSDNLSLREFYTRVSYNPAAGAGLALATWNAGFRFRQSATATAIDAFNATTFTNTNFGITPSISPFLAIQDGTTTPPSATLSALNVIELQHRDQTAAAFTTATAAGYTVTAPTAITIAAPFTGAFTGANQNATICSGLGATACGATATSSNYTVTATGTTATFNNPFPAGVDLYMDNGAGELVFVGTQATPTLNDNGATRVWSWVINISASAVFTNVGGTSGGAPVARQIFAFAKNAAGTVGVMAAPAVPVTITVQ